MLRALCALPSTFTRFNYSCSPPLSLIPGVTTTFLWVSPLCRSRLRSACHAACFYLGSEVGPPVGALCPSHRLAVCYCPTGEPYRGSLGRGALFWGPARSICVVCPSAVTPLFGRVIKWGLWCCSKTLGFRLEIFSICLRMTRVVTAIGFGGGPGMVGARGAVCLLCVSFLRALFSVGV